MPVWAPPSTGALYVPPSGGDDTARLDAARAASNNIQLGEGTYSYSGNGLDMNTLTIRGAGEWRTVVGLGAGKSLFTATSAVSSFYLSDMRVSQGFGGIRATYTGASVLKHIVVERVEFRDYTGAAISTMASDQPNWSIRDCVFLGVNDTATIGFAHNGDCANLLIEGCSFGKNRVGIKLVHGNAARILSCDFVRSVAYSGTPRTDIWMVPVPGAFSTSGAGLVVAFSKFGNENIDANDYRVLYADEGSGTDITDKFPTLAATSTGKDQAQLFMGNIQQGSSGAAPAFLTIGSTVCWTTIIGHQFAGTLPTNLIQYSAAAKVTIGGSPTVTHNVAPFNLTSGSVTLCDPAGMAQAVPA